MYQGTRNRMYVYRHQQDQRVFFSPGDFNFCFYWQPGITTDEIDQAVHQMIIDNGAYPSPLGYGGFPKSVCTSVNECICHGIPDSRALEVCLTEVFVLLSLLIPSYLICITKHS